MSEEWRKPEWLYNISRYYRSAGFSMHSGRIPGGLDNRRHRSFGPRKPPVAAITGHLITGELSLGQLAGDQYGPAHRVNFLRVTEGLFRGKNEDLLQHFNHVIVGVIVVVEQHHPIERVLRAFPQIGRAH